MKIHRSKIDNWFYAVVIGIGVLPFIMAVIFGGFAVIGLAICGAVVAFIIWLYLATKYVITDERLTVHGGLFRVSIPKASITSVTDTRNPLSSPAFSLDRLEIKYGEGKMILISPKDKTAFRSDLDISGA